MKRVFGLIVLAIVCGGSLYARASERALDVVGEMDFIEISPVTFSFETEKRKSKHKSATNRIWYAHFQADEDYESKPLFVFINGGPGCGTCMNLFAMNTAPYTLDRSKVSDQQLYAENKYSWTALGNLLYIDAPNTGFSYMVGEEENTDDKMVKYKEFVFGDNYNAFLDAAQMLRAVILFLENHPEIQKNEVIFVGESYSGVRVSTMLNMLLYYQRYADGGKVYQDEELAELVEAHLRTMIDDSPGPYPPETVAKYFKRQILIQPQIVDKYQIEDRNKAFDNTKGRSYSIMDEIGKDAGKTSWKDYLNKFWNKYWHSLSTNMINYLMLIDRDQYNGLKEWSWTDKNEYFSMQALNDIDALSVVTGDTDIRNVPYLLPENRKKALRFALDSAVPIYTSTELSFLINLLPESMKVFLQMIPYWKKDLCNMDNPINSLENQLGELTAFDSYVVGTNPYVFVGFAMNSGGDTLLEVAESLKWDPFSISPGSSDIYGRMFLENLALVDTFMTDAKYDLVVYSPTLASQFNNKKKRFKKMVKKLEVNRGNADEPIGNFKIYYKPKAIPDLEEVPKERTVNWYHYANSGHSVSSTEPEQFRRDVDSWLNKNQ